MHRLGIAASLLLGVTAAAIAAPAYKIVKTVPLGAPDRWDYVSFDARSDRVLVAHSDHTDLVDASSGAILGKLPGLDGAHGQAVAADGTIWADSGKTGQVTGYDPARFTALKTLPGGSGADAVIIDTAGVLLLVLDGDGKTATVINTAAKAVKSTIPLGGEPEFGASDAPGHFYVNIASTNEIAVVDAAAGRVTARYPVPACDSPHGLALDAQRRRLFATCENAVLISVDADSGRVLQTLPIGHGTDAAAFDPMRRQVFSSNGDGTLSVFQEDAAGVLSPLGDAKTALGARTMAIDPSSGRIFLVSADLAADRPVQGPHGARWSYKAGTVKLLLLGRMVP